MSLVTVVIPSYNSEKTIRRSLVSIAEQTKIPSKVIVVDDCSKDGTLALLNSLKFDFELVVIPLAANYGPAFARNIGWNNVTTKYVAFLDSDDTWHPSKLEIQTQLMLDSDAAISGHICTRPLYKCIDRVIVKQINARFCTFKNPYSTPSVMVKSEIPYRFNDNLRYAEDWNLWCRIMIDGYKAITFSPSLSFVHKPLYGSSGLSSQTFNMEYGELKSLFQLYKDGRINIILLNFSAIFSLIKFVIRLLRL